MMISASPSPSDISALPTLPESRLSLMSNLHTSRHLGDSARLRVQHRHGLLSACTTTNYQPDLRAELKKQNPDTSPLHLTMLRDAFNIHLALFQHLLFTSVPWQRGVQLRSELRPHPASHECPRVPASPRPSKTRLLSHPTLASHATCKTLLGLLRGNDSPMLSTGTKLPYMPCR
jgi:hypothetical protein